MDKVCNEMASMTLNGPKSPPMLLTTLNQWRLVSNCPMEEIEKDIKAIQRKLAEIRQDPNVLFGDWSSAEQAKGKGSPEAPVIAPDSQRKTPLCPPNVSGKQRKQKRIPVPLTWLPRNLGWYWINNQRQIGFCDFGSMVHVGANSAGAQAWSQKAVRKLDDNLEDNAHTPPYVEQTHVPPTGSPGGALAAPE